MKTIRKPISKAAAKPVISQPTPQLSLFVQTNYSGLRQDFAGTLAIRNLSTFDLNDVIESLQFRGSANATLVLFRSPSYQGGFRIIRGSRNIADLRDINFEDDISSLIMSNRTLTESDVRTIQNNRLPPTGYAEVLRRGKMTRRR